MYIENTVKDRVIDFLNKYGDKGYIVLKTIIDISNDPEIDHRLGDFSYKHLVFKLRKIGIDYNPHNIIRILEKEYGLIEKTYLSTTQKWWRLVDPETIRKTILEYGNGVDLEDPDLKLLVIKYRSIEPLNILNNLRRLVIKDKLSNSEKEFFRKIVFNELDTIVDLINKMQQYEEVFREELKILKEIISLSERVSMKIFNTSKMFNEKSFENHVYAIESEKERNSVKPW
ncbi:MAG: hypothetical protein QW607_00585 [Desulfurococcaceae archaeon]